MIEIKIQNDSYDIPTEWRDMTLRYWCGLYAVINKYNKRDEDGNIIEEEHSDVQTLKINRDIFMYLTGIKESQMQELDIQSVTDAVNAFSGSVTEYKPLGVDKFEQDGETYYFPKEFFKKKHFWRLYRSNSS